MRDLGNSPISVPTIDKHIKDSVKDGGHDSAYHATLPHPCLAALSQNMLEENVTEFLEWTT